MGQQQQPGELQIVFIYDCLRNQLEEDDPAEAILYWYPVEISVDKRVAICGQLMGVTQFFADSFSLPTIITLQNGKFCLRPLESKRQYLLALGCSSGVPDWVVQKQATILQQLILFFHGSLVESIIHESKRSLTTNRLNTMIEHYTNLSLCNGDSLALTFGILPMLHLPKSANTIPLQATILLHTCMRRKGVLGGVVMYQAKVIGVEAGQALAQKLAIIQPYKTPPADSVAVPFKLPLGVQLIYVYLTQNDLSSLNTNYSNFQHESSFSSSSSLSSSKVSHTNLSSRNTKNEIDSIQEEEFKDSLLSEAIENEYVKSNSGLGSSSWDDDIDSMKVTKARKISEIPCYRKSLEDISSLAVHCMRPNSLLKRSSSIADPLYPFIFPNGRCLTFALVNSLHEELCDQSDTTPTKELEDGINECDEDEEEESEGIDSQRPNEIVDPEPVTPVPTPKVASHAKPDKNVQKSRFQPSNQIDIQSRRQELTNIRRPADLPLQASKTVAGALRKKQRFWKTLDDVLSPTDYTVNGSSDAEIYTREQAASASQVINESVHQRLVNSFRKLANSEDDAEDESQLDEKESSTASGESSGGAGGGSLHSSYEKYRQGHHPKTKPKAPGNASSVQQHHSGETANIQQKFEKEILYMQCLGPMRLLLILDANQKLDCDFIYSLSEYGSSTMIDLKEALNTIVEDPTLQFSTQTSSYCYLSFDSVWKSLVTGGRNESMNFTTVQQMHQDFTVYPQMHELVIRGDEHAIYGYQCSGSEVYYQQSSSSAGPQPGLPMPTDLMGKVPAKAKRRLDRDHSILLL